MTSEFLVIVFKSVHFAIKGEDLLKADYEIKIMPTPREISSSCGVSIRIKHEDMDSLVAVLEKEIEEFTVYQILDEASGKSVNVLYKKE